MNGKLYVIEGVDGSGKATQTELLYQALLAEGKPVRKVSFPDYDSPSSSLIKMYLNGEFGTDPQSVNAFATSVFFAVDRFASFRKDWQEFYENGGIIIADRYVTSNLVHQAGKISDAAEKERYIQWLSDLEYNI
ncbi:MAG: thymidylate kinase, partial [Peptococcaceae bacterium]|nr:thymidylate kinase [Peptococcaceae bacterium]